VEYAYRHLAEVGVAWQFAAEDGMVLAAGFGELAAQLGAQGKADARDPVASVHAVLAMFATPWLVIFDNAADLAAVAAFLPPAGPGRVLITSQNPNWPDDQALHLPLLGAEVAADFLVSRTDDPDQRSARDLAGELDGLPLALEQAAAYVQAAQGTLTLAEYLVLFRQRRAEVLGRGEPTGYDKTVATTWRLAFENVQHAAPGAAGLLRLLAFCAPEVIPLRLLLQPRAGRAGRLGEQVAPVLTPLLEDPLAAGDAIAALRRYSLVTPAVGGSVSVHRLVQAVTAEQMPAELASQWHQAAAALIEAAIPDGTELPGFWPTCVALLPHAQAALDLTSNGMGRIALYLGYSGNYPAARNLFQLIADAYLEDDAYGPEHPDTLAARANLAAWTGAAGDAAAARDLLAALLPVYERVSGPEHPGTLAARGNLARWTGLAGDPAAARRLYAELLPDMERILGPEHPATLDTRRELARWTGQMGDMAALGLFATLLPDMERVLGPEHPDTLTTRHHLAIWTGLAGDPAAAQDLLAELLPISERVLGPEHPDTLDCRHNLASWTGQAGDPAAAKDQLAALLPVYERVHGPEHPKTLDTRASFAYWTGQAGDPAAAKDQLATLLPVRERVSGPEHPGTVAARASLASWTGQAGDPAAAKDQLAALLPVCERVFGPEHPDTLEIRRELARWTREADGDADLRRTSFHLFICVGGCSACHRRGDCWRGVCR
jgi:Tetratricopeptide repeat